MYPAAQLFINAYFLTVAVLWTAVAAWGVWTHRRLGVVSAFNYVLQGALIVSMFWPIIVYSVVLEWMRAG